MQHVPNPALHSEDAEMLGCAERQSKMPGQNLSHGSAL